MKQFLLVTLLVGITTASTSLLAQDEGATPQKRPPASPIKAEMKDLDEAIDAVADFLKKPEGDAPMAQVVAGQEALQKAKKTAPRLTDEQPEDQKAAFVIAYKVEINKTLRLMLDLEDAMLIEDWEAAGKTLDALGKLQKSGHDKFKGKRRRRR